jgi:hypothetical protein
MAHPPSWADLQPPKGGFALVAAISIAYTRRFHPSIPPAWNALVALIV